MYGGYGGRGRSGGGGYSRGYGSGGGYGGYGRSSYGGGGTGLGYNHQKSYQQKSYTQKDYHQPKTYAQQNSQQNYQQKSYTQKKDYQAQKKDNQAKNYAQQNYAQKNYNAQKDNGVRPTNCPPRPQVHHVHHVRPRRVWFRPWLWPMFTPVVVVPMGPVGVVGKLFPYHSCKTQRPMSDGPGDMTSTSRRLTA